MCTGIRLKAKNNAIVYARTLEFGADIQSQILFVPSGYECTSFAPSGKPEGLRWKTKYAAIGANAFFTTNFVDGVNEKGLSGGLFYFPGYAQYQKVSKEYYAQSLPMWQLLTWILTNFTSVQEVRHAMPSIFVSDTIFPQMGSSIPAHVIVHDEMGNSLVIEYIDGSLHMFDNPLGVFTNAPSFDWHITNVSNYLNLSPHNVAAKTMSGIPFAPLGQGSGMLGLPGDFTPPSRFVRAVAFTQVAPLVENEQQAIFQAFHILNNFDIPYGIALDDQGHSDHTLWTSAIDLKNRQFYFRPYANFQLHKIGLKNMNTKEPIMLSMQQVEHVIDISI